jgi:non-ribosomal peptide synthetase component F
MLSMRNRPEADKTFIEFLYEVKDNALNAYNNQDYQFEELVKKLGLHGTSDRNPLFSTVFSDMNLEKSLTDKRESIMTNKLGIRMERSKFVETTSKFDLRFAASYDFGEIKISITYSTNLFKLITMEKMAKRFLEILRQVLDRLDIKLKDIGISHDMTITTSDTFQDYQEDFEF